MITALATTFAASLSQQPAKHDISYLPSKFAVEIGGFGGPSYKVEIRDGKLHYKAETWRPKSEVVEKVITPTKEQWRSFWQQVEKVQLWQWSPDYSNRAIADGTQWRVKIEYNDKAISAFGSNGYPLEGNVAKSNQNSEPSLPFNQFLQAVRTLIGNLSFQ
jgi:hypothetical protein